MTWVDERVEEALLRIDANGCSIVSIETEVREAYKRAALNEHYAEMLIDADPSHDDITHFYNEKTWRSLLFWKARAEAVGQ